MGSLALLARELGYQVTGQDQHVYPPMSETLQQAGIDVSSGYEPSKALFEADKVLLGNALSRGNPSVEAVLEHRLNYFSGPEWLEHQILKHRRVLAVSGTHGKTTTTSLLTWILDYAGYDPGFLIGGVCKAWPVSARVGKGECFVIEADEYDTAFFDKRSKFLHYRPNVLVLNNLEFDHADIFPNLEAIETQFHHLIRTLSTTSKLIIPESNEAIQRVLARGCWSKLKILFDEGYYVEGTQPKVQLMKHSQSLGTLSGVTTQGRHNLQNTLSALFAAQAVGVQLSVALEAISTFPGVRRRLDLIGEHQGIRLYDDFAHHPTAIKETLATLKQMTKGKLIAAIEPRSNSMRLGVHKEALGPATQEADSVHWLAPPELPWDTQSLLSEDNDKHHLYTTPEALIDGLIHSLNPEDTVVFMSNGGFSGVQHRSMAALKEVR